MKKIIFLSSLIFGFGQLTLAEGSEIVYQCEAEIRPAKVLEFVSNDKTIQIAHFKAMGLAKRTLRLAILESLNKTHSGSDYLCDPARYIPQEPQEELTWQSFDRDEKFLIAECKYICKETTI